MINNKENINDTEKMSPIERRFLAIIKRLSFHSNIVCLELKELYKDEKTDNEYNETLTRITRDFYNNYKDLIELKKYCEFYGNNELFGENEKEEWNRIVEKYSYMTKDIEFKKLINKEFKFEITDEKNDYTSADTPYICLNERDMMFSKSRLIVEKKGLEYEKKGLEDEIKKLQDEIKELKVKVEELEDENSNLENGYQYNGYQYKYNEQTMIYEKDRERRKDPELLKKIFYIFKK